MDGDNTAKTFEQGANSAIKETDMSSGVHESVNQIPAAGEKTQGAGTSAFSKDGAIGKMFNADGAIGGTANKVGGPFDQSGMIGKQFNADGKIGGMVQENLANKK
ncbi:MAG: hypothetical protein Q9164_005961 [Protoblastenia rupestris]